MMRGPINAWLRWLGRHEGVVLLTLLACGLATWGFFALADRVTEGPAPRLDDKILRALRRPDNPAVPIGPAWVAEAARDVTAVGSVTVIALVTAAVTGYLLLDRKVAATVFMLIATGTGFLLSAALKAGYRRPRPEVVPHLMEAHYSSFPSGHSMVSAVVYLTLGALLTRLVAGWRLKLYLLTIAVLFTGLVGTSRVILGVHYPSDVLAGWCAGLVWASTCWLVGRRLQRRGAIEPGGASDVASLP